MGGDEGKKYFGERVMVTYWDRELKEEGKVEGKVEGEGKRLTWTLTVDGGG